MTDNDKPLGNQLAEAFEQGDTWLGTRLCAELMNATDHYGDANAEPEQQAAMDAQLGSLSIDEAVAYPNKIAVLINNCASVDAHDAVARLREIRYDVAEMDTTSGQLWLEGVTARLEREYGIEPEKGGPDFS
jgi:hypothetical protein